ncbi:MAG TPA: lantibiotic dehydratase [Gemmatimonadaceae bacterium]
MRQWTDALAVAAVLDRPDVSDAEIEGALAEDRARLRAGIAERLESRVILDAIHVASPDLEAALHYWRADPDSERGRRAERALVRYLSRMASRPTPFGLFAGNSVGVVAEQTSLELGPSSEYRRFTRLDSGYLFALIESLGKDPSLAATLRFRPNTTLMLSAGRWRYVEWRLDQAAAEARAFYERTHHLVAVDDSRYLRLVLDRAGTEAGVTIESLASAVAEAGVPCEQAKAYIHRLVENQILLPELPLYVTGRDPLPAIEDAVRAFGASEVADQMRAVTDALAAIDTDGPGVHASRYENVVQILETLPAKVDRARLLHVDLSKPAPAARLGANVIREITAGAELLRRFGRSGDSLLDTFRHAFMARYEGRQVPLLEALDEEIGVGFPIRGDASPDAEPLLAGLAFPSRMDPTAFWGSREATLLQLLANALTAGSDEIVLTQRDIDGIATTNAPPPPLPNAYGAMVTIAARSEEALKRGDFRLLLSGISGPSGANLMGRFCHADETLTEKVREHCRAEEALDPDAVFAEVAHLAHPRAGNIVARPLLREFEITYMGRSGAPIDRQIPASDLLVSVEGGRAVLRSARLGKRVVPRLTSAHAFTRGNVGIYHFLCALQLQGVAPTAWSWGPLAGSPFLPRVRSGRVVLSLARWQVPREELELLGKASGAALMRAVRTWRANRKLPRFVNVADGDNMLLVDLDNVLSVESFIQLVRQRGHALLEEVFPGDDELIARGPEGRFAHELLVPFVRSAPTAPAPAVGAKTQSTPAQSDGLRIARQNAPGSEWMYAKIYSGGPTADRVLSRAVAPLVQRAMEQGWIDSWFFIRYADPEPHLRVRFHGACDALRECFLPALDAVVLGQLEVPGVWRAQIDTYEREIERYGGDEGMLISEQVFHADSDAAVALADLVARGRLNAADRWRVALVSADLLIGDLGLDAAHRRAVVEKMSAGYRAEHAVTPPLARVMSERFRTEKPRLSAMLRAARGANDVELGRGVCDALDVLRARSARLAPIGSEVSALSREGRLSVSLAELASSHTHMSVNRQLRSALRAQETVIYDFLTRLHAIPGLA